MKKNNMNGVMDFILKNKLEKRAIVAGLLNNENECELIERKRNGYWQIILEEKRLLINARAESLSRCYYLLVTGLKNFCSFVKNQSLELTLIENENNCHAIIHRGDQLLNQFSCPSDEFSRELKKKGMLNSLYEEPLSKSIKQKELALEYFLLYPYKNTYNQSIWLEKLQKEDLSETIYTLKLQDEDESNYLFKRIMYRIPKKQLEKQFPELSNYLLNPNNYCVIKSVDGNTFLASLGNSENEIVLQTQSDTIKDALEELEFTLKNNQRRIRKSE